MRRIRKGKDILVQIRILTNGEQKSLEDRDIRVILVTPLRSRMEMKFSVNDDTVQFRFPGSEQEMLGKYLVTVWENYGKEGQTAVDFKAFHLVPDTFSEGGNDDEGLDTETVELSGTIESGVKGLSAYELAVENGYKGTVDEWLESLHGKPLTYDDLTPEQIEELQKPAKDIAEKAEAALSLLPVVNIIKETNEINL